MKKIFFKIESLGLHGAMILLYRLLITRIFYPGQKIIRQGNRIRGKKFIQFTFGLNLGVGNRIDILDNSALSKSIPHLVFGKNVEINDYCHIACAERIEIGDDVLIASKVFITDHNHGDSNCLSDFLLAPKLRRISSAPVIIKSNVWIGEGVTVLPGVVIGENSIIGAGAVVTKNIPDFSIAVGVPAKVLRRFDFKK